MFCSRIVCSGAFTKKQFCLQKLGLDMFHDVRPNEHKQFLDYVRRAVIATDLSVHMPKRQQLADLIKDKMLNLDEPEHL